jgi:hypothetical protein
MWVNFNSVSILCFTEERMLYLQLQEVMWVKIDVINCVAPCFFVWKDEFLDLSQEIPILTAVFHDFSQPHSAALKYYILLGHDILSSTSVLINFSLWLIIPPWSNV